MIGSSSMGGGVSVYGCAETRIHGSWQDDVRSHVRVILGGPRGDVCYAVRYTRWATPLGEPEAVDGLTSCTAFAIKNLNVKR